MAKTTTQRTDSQKSKGSRNQPNLRKLLQTFLVDQKCNGNSKKTISYYDFNVNNFLNWLEKEYESLDIEIATLEQVKLYIIHLKNSTKYDINKKAYTDEPLSSKTIQTYIRAIKTFYGWLGEEGFIDENISSKIKLPKATKKAIDILSEEEIKTVMDYLKKKKTNHYRDIAIFSAFIELGARLSEVANLQMSNIRFEQSILKVLGKGNKERFIVFGNNLQKAFMKYIQYERPTPLNAKIDHIFLKEDGTAITSTTVEQLFKRLKKATGVDKLHCHLCRHTMITMSLAHNSNVFDLRRKTGHTSFDIMDNYVHLAEGLNNMKNNTSLLDNLNIK